jgi:glycosyltransferase involved in cell wall biosynthesis
MAVQAAAMPLKLLHITTIPMSLTFLRGQVSYMRERGLEVHALSSPGPDLEAFSRSEGLAVTAVEMPRRITPFADLTALYRIVACMRRLRPHIVHGHTPKGGLLGMVAARLAGVPVRVYHMRGLPLTGASGIKRRLLWMTERVACSSAHRIICVSHSVREEAVSSGVCAPDRITVLRQGSGNGVDARGRFDPDRLGPNARHESRARFGIPDGAVVVGFVGRIVRDKGLVELAEAWQELRRRFTHLHLLLVGPFEPQDPLPQETERTLRSDTSIHLAGMEWDTPPLYAAMDLVVLPTYREGFPNVPLEAAAMGLPVVATSIPGCVDAVQDGRTGLLVPPRDARALRQAVEQYVADAKLRASHGAAGRARVLEHFRPDGIWEAIYEEYATLLRARGVAPPPSAETTAARR